MTASAIAVRLMTGVGAAGRRRWFVAPAVRSGRRGAGGGGGKESISACRPTLPSTPHRQRRSLGGGAMCRSNAVRLITYGACRPPTPPCYSAPAGVPPQRGSCGGATRWPSERRTIHLGRRRSEAGAATRQIECRATQHQQQCRRIGAKATQRGTPSSAVLFGTCGGGAAAARRRRRRGAQAARGQQHDSDFAAMPRGDDGDVTRRPRSSGGAAAARRRRRRDVPAA